MRTFLPRPAAPGRWGWRGVPTLCASAGAPRGPLRKRLREGGSRFQGVRLGPAPASRSSGLRPPATDWENEAGVGVKNDRFGSLRGRLSSEHPPNRRNFWESGTRASRLALGQRGPGPTCAPLRAATTGLAGPARLRLAMRQEGLVQTIWGCAVAVLGNSWGKIMRPQCGRGGGGAIGRKW